MLCKLQQKLKFVQCKRRSDNAFEISATIETSSGETFDIVILLDSGYTEMMINEGLQRKRD